MENNNPPPGLEEFISAPASPMPDDQERAPASANEPPPGLEEFIAPELNQVKYGGLGSSLLTGTEKAADALTFTGAGRLENYLADKFDMPEFSKQAQAARAEANPVASFLGGATGFGTMLALTGGFGGAGAVAGEGLGLGAEAAASAAAKTAAQAGAEAGLTGAKLASAVNTARAAALADFTTAGRIGSAAVKAGVETAIYSSGNEAAKMIFKDPGQTLGTAAANIGLNGLLGAGVGALVGGAGELWNAKFGPKVTADLEGVKNAINKGEAAEIPASNVDDFNQPAAAEELYYNTPRPSPEGGKGFKIIEFKPNAAQVMESSDRLGIKPTEGMLDKESLTGHMQDEIAKQNNVAGRIMAKRLESVEEKLADHTKEVMADATEHTQSVAGAKIREGLVADLKKELAPISEGYEAEKPHLKAMELTPEAKAEAVAPILSHEFVAEFPDSAIAKQATKIADEIQNLKNVNSVKTYRTMLNGELDKAVASNDSNLISVLKTAKQSLNGLRERGISESSIAIAAKEGDEIAADTIGRLRQLDADFAAHRLKTAQTGEALGLGKVKSVAQLEAKLGKLNLKDESLPGKIFDPDNVEKLKFFQENFPDQFDLARRSKIRDIYEKSINTSQGGGEKLSVQKFLTQVNDKNMNPEDREMLFPGMAQKIKDIKVVQANFPGTFNTSNTAAALGFFDNIGHNVIDLGKLALTDAIPHLKNLVKGGDEASQIAAAKILASGEAPTSASGFRSMLDYISHVIKGENLINKSVKNVFEGAVLAIPQKGSDKDREKLDKKLISLQENPDAMFELHADLGHYLPDHAMEASKTAANAVGYLNSLRPGNKTLNPLDKPLEPSEIEKAKFNNALNIANDPLLVLEKVRKGTVTPEDILHLRNIYPSLYDKLNQKLTHGLIDAVHEKKQVPYSTKMGLSLFLGQPLDGTMTPQGIMAAQPKPMMGMQQMQQPSPQRGHHSSMKNIGKLATADQTPQQARLTYKQNKN